MIKLSYLPLLIIFSLTLFGCASVDLATPGTTGPTLTGEAPSSTPAPVITTTSVITPTYEACAYMWASHDLTDLSKKVDTAFKAIDPNLIGSAYAYGEDCVYADGHSTFSAMETDFRAKVSVTDLQDEKTLGDWITKVMNVIVNLPPDGIQGPQPGRVDFEFDNSASVTLHVNVSIAKYKTQAAGLTGAELFKYFNNNP